MTQTHIHLKPGQAQIRQIGAAFLLTYVNEGSWLIGERTYGAEHFAREFCAERGLRVL